MLVDLKIGPRYDGFLFLAESARNPPALKSHRHVELELNLVAHGTITYVVGNQRFTFGPRTLLWMYPSQDHQLVDRSDDAQYYVAVFKPALIAACRGEVYAGLKRDKLEDHEVLHTVLEPGTFDLIRKTMDVLVADGLDPDILNREAGFGITTDFSFEHGDPDGLNAGLRHLLLLCWRQQQRFQAPTGAVALHPAVRKALSLLSEDGWDVSLGRLAARCGLSPAHLSRVFSQQVGVPLSRYRNSVRLERFWEHYRQPEHKTLTEAMYAAGFGSYAQFYKVFFQAYGRGPRSCINEESRQFPVKRPMQTPSSRLEASGSLKKLAGARYTGKSKPI